VFLVICGVWPAAAHAQGGFWDYIEGGSGPGPFAGYTGVIRLRCIKQETNTQGKIIYPRRRCSSDIDDNIRAVWNLNVGWYSSGDNPRFTNTPTVNDTIDMTRVGSTFMYRVHPVIDVGVGGGVIALSGSGFKTQWHPEITAISVTFTPLGFLPDGPRARKLKRFLRFNFSDRVVFRPIDSVDFGLPATYLKGAEFQRDFSWGLDLGSLWR
jgi:hypothetical protein